MTIATSNSDCLACGAPNLGTRYCENCGAEQAHSGDSLAPGVEVAKAAPAAAPIIGEAPAPNQPSDPATGLRIAALLTFLLGLIIVSAIYIAGSNQVDMNASIRWTSTVSALVVALFMALAAGAGRADAGGKGIGIFFALAYAIAVPLIQFNVSPLPDGAYDWLPVVGPVLLFASWAGGRSFKAGWAAVIAVIFFGYFSTKVAPAVGSGPLNYASLQDTYFILALIVIVQLANGFDGPKPGTRRVNGAARTSLILLLTSLCLNALAGNLQGAGTIAMFVLILLLVVLAIILGHVGYVRAGRRNERGRGLAITALIFGYIVAVLNTIVLIYLASILAAFSSLSY